jgi:hypothetical protein
VMLQGQRGRVVIAWALAMLAIGGVGTMGSRAGASELRHFEQVSPAEKGGSDIAGEGQTVVASLLGDAVTFSSRTVFGDAIGSGVVGQTAYLARRSSAGWETHAITPAPRPDAAQTLAAPTTVTYFSDDLATALVYGYDLPGATGDTPNRMNLYIEDTATRALRTVTASQVDGQPFSEFREAQNIWGLSTDLKHVAFVSPTQFLLDATPGVPNVYMWDDGVLSVAGVLPDGTVPSGGSTIDPLNLRGTVSADGTRVVFTSPADGNPPQLYVRIDGSRTVWVSKPEPIDGVPPDPDPNPDPGLNPTGVVFQGTTPDGRNIFFVSDTPLLSEDTAPGPDLYRYTDSANPDTDANLTLITNDGAESSTPNSGTVLVGMSNDAERVYYHNGASELKVWDHGVTHAIAAGIPRPSDPARQLTLPGARPGYGRVTPDGNWFAFLHDGEMYVYSLRADELRCATCSVGPSDVTVEPSVTGGLAVIYAALRPRFLSDGGRVFFSTTKALRPEDVNGVADTYEYDGPTAALSLITSGKGSEPAMFANASVSGDDVFLVTRQRLATSDQDDFVDLYDARVGAAPPTPPVDAVPPCTADACQPPPSLAPTDDLLGSLALDESDTAGTRHASLSVRARATFHGASGALRVKLGSAGRLEWRGRGVIGGSSERTRAGTVKIRLRLDARARAKLRRTGAYSTSVRLTFEAADGTDAHQTVRVTFKVAARGR